MEVFMVVNKGFSFNNMVGLYGIKEVPARYPKYTGETENVIMEMYPGKLTPIYSNNSYEEGSIAYEFASIDTSDLQAILDFCLKYGLLSSDRLIRNTTNDYLFMKQTKSIFSEAVPNYEPDETYVRIFTQEVLTMRNLLSLKSALDSNNYVGILQALLSLLLCYTTRAEVENDSETERFTYYFYLYIDRKEKEEALTIANMANFHNYLSDYLNELNYFVHASKEEWWLHGTFDATELNDMHHCTWQNYYDILDRILQITQISVSNDISELFFSTPLTDELIFSTGITIEMLHRASMTCMSDMFNSQTYLITPELQYENGKLSSDWHISSLLEAMYMELLVSFTPNTQVKKCANPTCNSFFEVGVGNSRKIYCSQRCSLLMAKRKQRERDKLKK